jgi:hypothetical protein
LVLEMQTTARRPQVLRLLLPLLQLRLASQRRLHHLRLRAQTQLSSQELLHHLLPPALTRLSCLVPPHLLHPRAPRLPLKLVLLPQPHQPRQQAPTPLFSPVLLPLLLQALTPPSSQVLPFLLRLLALMLLFNQQLSLLLRPSVSDVL